MKQRILRALLLVMFSISLYAVSLNGEIKIENNKQTKDQLTSALDEKQDLNVPEIATKSKTNITMSAMPAIQNFNINTDILHEEIISNIKDNQTEDSAQEDIQNNIEENIQQEDTQEEIINETIEEVTEEIVEDTQEEVIEYVCPNRWGITLTNDEIYLLGCIVMLESGGESDLGQQAVTEVIFNRMVDDYFGGSLYEVLSRPGQFTTWKNRNSKKAYPTERVMNNIHRVLNGETYVLPFETVYFAKSAQNSRVQSRIGGHVFCNE